MNIYSKKQRWKFILFIIAIVIVGSSLWYTNTFVRKIANEERKNVQLWAKAIQRKAKLIKYTSELFVKLGNEERKNVELWAEASRQLAASDKVIDYTFILKVVSNNTTVPVILADENNKIISYRNLDPLQVGNSKYLYNQMRLMASFYPPIEINIYGNRKNYLYYKDSKLFSELRIVMNDIIQSFISEIVINTASVPVIFIDEDLDGVLASGNIDTALINDNEKLQKTLIEMAEATPPIEIELEDGHMSYIFYQNSYLLTQLKYYPYGQIGIIAIFLLIAYWLFSTARKAEQNQVWVGMAKETAHQLGTPLSSLLAWIELLKEEKGIERNVNEMQKDVSRLQVITDRFSKIGAKPKLEEEDVLSVIRKVVEYMQKRVSDKIIVTITPEKEEVIGLLCPPLFEWVIENLFKNAADAMSGEGTININVSSHKQWVYVDISDTGKGIPLRKQKTIFEPGYTSKQRGWGLGLSLAKRIIESYHNGKIFVKHSEIGKGSTFRIVLSSKA